ncbi:5-methyltetrahydropteroyltriglutamate--homocysteine S-methyltransferase [Terrarubrum flagellatum]|uniref:5-methyltetrahydropteroyltriglutamate-- homocysteine S-methyltransferase n=1 Tax=Terrirubrum flagellatum TaxID=2895980 RepID=UPI003145583B
MRRTKPPFRADMVGSLLRTVPLKEAREKREKGEISAEALREIEDREIRKIVKRQEDIGLQAVTDGEFRRTWWHFDFLFNLDGVERVILDHGIQFAGVQTKAEAPRVTSKIGFSNHPFLEHFRFLKGATDRVAKMTIPSPSMLHYRGGRKMIQMGLYPDMEEYYRDLANAYATAVKSFYEAGCRYLQLDDTSLSYFCDPEQRKMLAERGDDPDLLIQRYRDMINTATKNRPADMTITSHTCRGNFKSTFVASGGYEPVADLVFNQIDIDGYFMEWDDDRSGGFAPLRLLPKGKYVVLGLVTTKTGALEKKDDIKRRIDAAAKYVDLDQLCLSPQCGFASTEEGNVLAEDEQWWKLEMIVEIAREVWG